MTIVDKNLENLRPCRREGVVIVPYGSAGEKGQRYIIKDASESFYIITSKLGIEIFNKFNGVATLCQLTEQLQAKNVSLSIDKIRTFTDLCFSNCLIEPDSWPIGTAQAKKESRREKLGIYSQTYNVNDFLDMLISYRHLWLNKFTKALFFAVFFFGLLSLLVIPEGGGLLAPLKQMSFTITDVFLVALPFIFLIELSLHELAHALSCRLMGAKTDGFGIGLLWGVLPIFYTETTDAYTIQNKYKRMFVSFAGPMVNIFFFGLSMGLYFMLTPGLLQNLVLAYSGLSLSAFVVSLNPFLIRMDGYWILSDWLEEPSLKRDAIRYLTDVCGRLLGRKVSENSITKDLSGNTYLRARYVGYAVIAAGWTGSYIAYMLFETFNFVYKAISSGFGNQVFFR